MTIFRRLIFLWHLVNPVICQPKQATRQVLTRTKQTVLTHIMTLFQWLFEES